MIAATKSKNLNVSKKCQNFFFDESFSLPIYNLVQNVSKWRFRIFFFPRTLLKTPGSKLIIYNLLLRVFHLIFAKPLLKFNFLCFITSITLSLFEGKKAKWKRSQSFSVPFISYFSYLRLSSSFPRTFLV